MAVPNSGGNYEKVLPKKGIHLARLFAIIDTGTQKSSFNGKEKLRRIIIMRFELPGSLHEFDKDKGPEPLAVNVKETFSSAEKSNLYKFFKAWSNSKITAKRFGEKDFSITKYIGKSAELTLKIQTSESGDDYVKIIDVTKDDENQCGDPINKPYVFMLHDLLGYKDEELKEPLGKEEKKEALKRATNALARMSKYNRELIFGSIEVKEHELELSDFNFDEERPKAKAAPKKVVEEDDDEEEVPKVKKKPKVTEDFTDEDAF